MDYHGIELHCLSHRLHHAIDTPAQAATVQYIITLTTVTSAIGFDRHTLHCII